MTLSPWLAEIDEKISFILEQVLDTKKTPAKIVKEIQNLPLDGIYEKLSTRAIARSLLEVFHEALPWPR